MNPGEFQKRIQTNYSHKKTHECSGERMLKGEGIRLYVSEDSSTANIRTPKPSGNLRQSHSFISCLWRK